MKKQRDVNTSPAESSSSLQKAINPQDTPERFRLGEMGVSGLQLFCGVSQEELKRDLNFPTSLKTYKSMSYHAAINSSLTLFENLLGNATFRVVPPKDATEAEKKQAEILTEMLDDMEHGMTDFIKEVLSMLIYGFSVQEIVFRRRYNVNGSKYNDGIIGWKKLPIRAQDSIQKFIFSEDGQDIVGVKQIILNTGDTYNRYLNKTEVVIPRKKFLLFRTGRHRGDPYGKSPLRDAYLSWRYLTALEEIEANGVAKDLQGLPVLSIPSQYMSADASPAQKAAYQYYQNVIRNIQNNQQAGLVLPSDVDPDTKQSLFKMELLSTEGKKNFDTDKVKAYYKNLIFTSLFSDILQMGQSATGSFALGQIKNSMAGTMAESILRGIVDVINRELIRTTYEVNGWDVSRMCKLDYEELESTDLESYSKAIQRYSSVQCLPKTHDVINSVLASINVDPIPEDVDLAPLMGEFTSRSGDGLATPFEGTRTSAGAGNDNDNNMDNNA